MIVRNNKVLKVNHKWLYAIDQYNPLKLPPYTIRVKCKIGTIPEPQGHTYTQTLFDRDENIWDITITDESTDWSGLFDYPNEYQYDLILEVLGANSAGITDMHNMFKNCRRLTSVAVFNTSSVTDMSFMFNICSLLTSVPSFDTTAATNMTGMFAGCEELTTVPLLNTSNVTDTSGMFEECKSITTVPLFDTSNVTNTALMFLNCYNLTTVPLFNTSKVTSMMGMFMECSSLTAIPLFNTSSVTDMSLMFNNCVNVESGALALYQQASTQTIVPQHMATFAFCGVYTQTGAAEWAQIPNNWK